MTPEVKMALMQLLGKAGEGDFLRDVMKFILQQLMEVEVEVRRSVPTSATGTGSGAGRRGSGRWI